MNRPIKILLIEDNRADVLLVHDALRQSRLESTIHEISDADEAVLYIEHLRTAADAPRPDVVILDLNLPKGDGIDLLKSFRKCPGCAHTPVIVMTSSDSPADHARVAAIKATQYFRKPLELDAFLALGILVRSVVKS